MKVILKILLKNTDKFEMTGFSSAVLNKREIKIPIYSDKKPNDGVYINRSPNEVPMTIKIFDATEAVMKK